MIWSREWGRIWIFSIWPRLRDSPQIHSISDLTAHQALSIPLDEFGGIPLLLFCFSMFSIPFLLGSGLFSLTDSLAGRRTFVQLAINWHCSREPCEDVNRDLNTSARSCHHLLQSHWVMNDANSHVRGRKFIRADISLAPLSSPATHGWALIREKPWLERHLKPNNWEKY